MIAQSLTAGPLATSKENCKLTLRIASPQGPECGGTIVMHDVIVERIEKIGPVRMPPGADRSTKT